MAITLLDTVSASGDSTVEFATSIDATYAKYEIWGSNIVCGTDAVVLGIRVSTDGGSTWKSGATDYAYAFIGPIDEDSAGAATILLGRASAGERQGGAAGENSLLYMEIVNPSESSYHKIIHSQYSASADTGGSLILFGSGRYVATTAVDGIQLLFSSGTISGEFKLYGIQAS